MKLIFEIEVNSPIYTKENGIEAEQRVKDLLYQFCRNVHRRKDLEESLIIIEDLISSKSVNKKLSDNNKKLNEHIIQAENNLKSSQEVNKKLLQDNKNLAERLTQFETGKISINYAGINEKVAKRFINNHELELKLRLDNLTDRIINVENWIKQCRSSFIDSNDCIR